jgi:phosphoribosylaminoimidazole carboxylase (NCAIR synthetase)
MLAMAAAQLGYRAHIYAPDEAPPAAAVASDFTRGDYDDEKALPASARSVDVATYEFENISAGALNALAARTLALPPRRALEIARGQAGRKGVRRQPRRGRRLSRRSAAGRIWTRPSPASACSAILEDPALRL